MANLEISKVRNAFSSQRAQCIIVDLVGMPVNYLNNCTKAVEDILTLACSIRGATRIPLFGLAVLRKTPLFLYELDLVRANYHKIIAALHSLPTYCEAGLSVNEQEFEKCLYGALDKYVNLFNFKLENNELNIDVHNLEVTIISVKDTKCVKTYLETVRINKERIHKISVIQLINCSVDEIPSVSALPDFIETFVTSGNIYYLLENHFRHWLIEQADSVDVLLHLPGPDTCKFSLQCDIYECQLNPLSLPFGSRAFVQLDCLSVQLNGMSVAKTAPSTIPVYEFNIVSRLETSALCDSTVYGTPLCLRPTNSTKLPLKDRQMNQEHFTELCSQLKEQELVLLARLKSHLAADQFTPYFLLTPGVGCFLLKCFISGDLALPWKRQVNEPTVSDETSARVYATLQHVSLIKELAVDTMDTGLLRALAANLKQNKLDPNTQDTLLDDFVPKRLKRSLNK